MKMKKILFKSIFLKILRFPFTRTFFHSNLFPDPSYNDIWSTPDVTFLVTSGVLGVLQMYFYYVAIWITPDVFPLRISGVLQMYLS